MTVVDVGNKVNLVIGVNVLVMTAVEVAVLNLLVVDTLLGFLGPAFVMHCSVVKSARARDERLKKAKSWKRLKTFMAILGQCASTVNGWFLATTKIKRLLE